MDATLACARAGVTTGEWAFALREVFGEYRAPTGVGGAPVTSAGPARGAGRGARGGARHGGGARGGQAAAAAGQARPGRAFQRRRADRGPGPRRRVRGDLPGIRLTPEQIAAAAVAEDVHCVGLSILSGGHAELVPEVLRRLRQAGAGDIPVVVGGIIPPADAASLRAQGVAAVFTPRDFGITAIIGRIVEEIRPARELDPSPPAAPGRRPTTIEG